MTLSYLIVRYVLGLVKTITDLFTHLRQWSRYASFEGEQRRVDFV